MAAVKRIKFILRPFKAQDAKKLAKNINNKIIAKNTLTIPYPYKIKDAKKWLKSSIEENKKGIDVNFCIEIDKEVAGSVSLNKISKKHKAELGYWLAEKYWGKGIMTRAVKEITGYGFNKLKLKRIFAFTFPFNKASIKVLEKNRFKLEGILKKNVKKDGEFIDAYIFSKIK